MRYLCHDTKQLIKDVQDKINSISLEIDAYLEEANNFKFCGVGYYDVVLEMADCIKELHELEELLDLARNNNKVLLPYTKTWVTSTKLEPIAEAGND